MNASWNPQATPHDLVFDQLDHPGRAVWEGPTFTALAILTASVWFGNFSLSVIANLIHPPSDALFLFGLRSIYALLGCALCVPLHLLLVRLRSRGFVARIVILLPALILASVVYCHAEAAIERAAAIPVSQRVDEWNFYTGVYWAMLFSVWSALYVALTYSWELAAQAERSRRMEALAYDAQIRALRYQIDPHFLFNALNSISALIMTDRRDDADAMVAKLALFFRASVATDPADDIGLSDEIALQQTYLEIEQVRFPDLTIRVAVSPDVAGVRVPTLLLQPIIENAIKFGVTSQEAPSNIIISAEAHGAILEIKVTNDCPRHLTPVTGTGTGLRNVRDRLQLRYGDLCSLDARRTTDRFQVRLRIPMVRR